MGWIELGSTCKVYFPFRAVSRSQRLMEIDKKAREKSHYRADKVAQLYVISTVVIIAAWPAVHTNIDPSTTDPIFFWVEVEPTKTGDYVSRWQLSIPVLSGLGFGVDLDQGIFGVMFGIRECCGIGLQH